ncbi:delta-1-pyrroline-5-carboxylate synthase [Ixodes scapularis]|uniref:delta-1-pyrroline-5-carboxylate synthase n=1 Tax=Ixodes scapularis TaxID=6945 RepID=UPI001A9EAF7D|nr:delta-1-pyrroline-5-carboxylate synthase [Ixodes scapularis]XP_040071489.1 delta-1-pyrroline-5-carboxylate synthase [Ixodes scapularis]
MWLRAGARGLAYGARGLDRVLEQQLGKSSRRPSAYRSELSQARRVVVKLGTAVLTREDECGLALGRLASIVEQLSQLQNEGKEMLIVTSGAVAFGKQRLNKEMRMSMSMRETLALKESSRPAAEDARNPHKRASAAVGQSGLMALYDAMFNQYGVNIAQVLVTRPDFYNPDSRHWLRQTLLELISLNIIPIINTNDAVSSPFLDDQKLSSEVGIMDNDSLAAHLAVEADADLLLMMSNVDGIYTRPPGQDGAKLLHTYNPSFNGSIQFGSKSKVGLGGMESKIKAACWALERGVSVVIGSGFEDMAITRIVQGKRVGTFFTNHHSKMLSLESMAANARQGSRLLEALSASDRAAIITCLADLLESRTKVIMEANLRDLQAAREENLSDALLARLELSPAKLSALADGLRTIARTSHDVLGRVVRRTRIAEGMDLTQVTVPIGVLLVIFESRPDCLPQVAALAMATGNGLLLKGGREASHSNRCLFQLAQEALAPYGASDAITLVSTREDVEELLQLEGNIDLVIPRGSAELVRTIQEKSRGIPVLGHSDGVCHVYVDRDADPEKAKRIVVDSKCDYPAACNAMETLLIHRDLVDSGLLTELCTMLKAQGVRLHSGSRLAQLLTFGPPAARSMRIEYSDLECAVEVVSSVQEALDHVNTYGSAHTDAIVTENHETAERFLQGADSACVFHNCSTRFADGYRFGLGAEVGISTGRIHARGPVGLDGLLTTKWMLRANGNVVQDFNKNGSMTYLHEHIPVS